MIVNSKIYINLIILERSKFTVCSCNNKIEMGKVGKFFSLFFFPFQTGSLNPFNAIQPLTFLSPILKLN